MFKKAKQQKEYKERYEDQKSVCECGYPYSLQPVIMKEGFGIKKRIYEEYENICKICGLKYKRIR